MEINYERKEFAPLGANLLPEEKILSFEGFVPIERRIFSYGKDFFFQGSQKLSPFIKMAEKHLVLTAHILNPYSVLL